MTWVTLQVGTFAVLLPARAAAVIPVVIGLGLAGSSVLSPAEVATLTQTDRQRFVGPASRTWVSTMRPPNRSRTSDRVLRARYVLALTSLVFHGEPVTTVALTDIEFVR